MNWPVLISIETPVWLQTGLSVLSVSCILFIKLCCLTYYSLSHIWNFSDNPFGRAGQERMRTAVIPEQPRPEACSMSSLPTTLWQARVEHNSKCFHDTWDNAFMVPLSPGIWKARSGAGGIALGTCQHQENVHCPQAHCEMTHLTNPHSQSC